MQPPTHADRPALDLADLTGLKAVQATDLAADPSRRALWRGGGTGAGTAAGGGVASAAGLPPEGLGSPMGFWLSCPTLPSELSPGGLLLRFVAHGEDAGPPAATLSASPFGPGRRPAQTVRVKPPNAGDGDVLLTLGPGGARVAASPAAWKGVAEPVLLAVCLYWRFAAIDAEIARLTALAHGDLDHANMPGLATLRDRGRLMQAARDARALMLDLPHFQGPLTDPLPYCTTERAATVFETLAEKLHLEAWCEAIDERAEAVEDAYEALAEKSFEFRNFAVEAALEVVIVVILLAELALGFYEAMTP